MPAGRLRRLAEDPGLRAVRIGAVVRQVADAVGARRASDGLPVCGGVEADHARRAEAVKDADLLERAAQVVL